MFPDGICRVTDSYYTKTVQFQDINYQLNQNEDKTAIFDSWCDFLNYFDSSTHFQLSFVNFIDCDGNGLIHLNMVNHGLLMIYQLSCSFCRRNHDGISAGNGNILGILCDNLQNIGIRRS